MDGGVLSVLVTIGSIAVFTLLMNLWLLKAVRQLKRELNELKRAAGTARSEPEPKATFSASLDRVERETAATPARAIPQADRYRYVGALAEQGLDAGKIASALQMAQAEVEQLLQLARLKQNVAGRR